MPGGGGSGSGGVPRRYAALERPDEENSAQTKTDDPLEHEQAMTLMQARRACLCSARYTRVTWTPHHLTSWVS